jgi:translation elongation factor EF-Ts
MIHGFSTEVKDPDMTVEKFVASKGGEVKSFVRFEVGEGPPLEATNFSTVISGSLTNGWSTKAISALNPRYVNESQIPQEELEHEKAVLTEQALNEGKPANI